jgi:hypothetical protein
VDGVSEFHVLSDLAQIPDDRVGRLLSRSATWRQAYRRQLIIADFAVAVAAAGLGFGADTSSEYLLLSALLPTLWMMTLRVVVGHKSGFRRTGSDEFRDVLNSGVGLSAGLDRRTTP